MHSNDFECTHAARRTDRQTSRKTQQTQTDTERANAAHCPKKRKHGTDAGVRSRDVKTAVTGLTVSSSHTLRSLSAGLCYLLGTRLRAKELLEWSSLARNRPCELENRLCELWKRCVLPRHRDHAVDSDRLLFQNPQPHSSGADASSVCLGTANMQKSC